MNRGLKSYTKQIKNQIGIVNTYVNINPNDANLILDIPLFQTKGAQAFNLNLYLNLQSEEITMFGKGCKLNTQYESVNCIDLIKITNPDGSLDLYATDTLKNLETGTRIEMNEVDEREDKYNYHIYDKNDNYYYFQASNLKFPDKIVMKNGTIIYQNENDDTFEVYNYKNTSSSTKEVYSKIVFNKENNLVKSIVYYENNNKLEEIILEYDDHDYISAIKYYKLDNLVNYIGLRFNYGNLMVYDLMVNDGISFWYTEDYQVTSIQPFYDEKIDTNEIITIEYKDSMAIVSDKLGNVSTTCFNSYDLPMLEYDNYDNMQAYTYDINTKKILSKSNVIKSTDSRNLLDYNDINDFDLSGDIEDESSYTYPQTRVFKPLQNQNIRYMYGSGKLQCEIQVNGQANENLMFSLLGHISWGDENTNVKITLSTDNDYLEKNFKLYSSLYELMTLGLTTTKSYSYIKIVIYFKNCEIELSNPQLFNINYGTEYEYDDDWNLVKTKSGYGCSDYNYNDNNVLENVYKSDSSYFKNEYDDKNRVISSINGYGVKTDYEYDYNNNVIKETITYNGNTYTLKNEYNNGGILSLSYDEINNIIAYTYDSLGKIKEIYDQIGNEHIFIYNELEQLTKFRIRNDNVSKSIQYSYEDNLLDCVDLENGESYQFEYDNKGNVISISIDNKLCYSVTYDEFSRLKTLKYGTDAEFSFSYYKNDLIKTVSYGSSLRYTYNYDEFDRLINIVSNNKVIVSYVYDNESRLINEVRDNEILTYTYDSKGKLTNTNKNVDDIEIMQSYNDISKSQGLNPQSIIYSILDDNTTGFDVNNSGDFDVEYDSLLPCLKQNRNKPLQMIWKNDLDLPQGVISYWFKPSKDKKTCLFNIKSEKNNSLIEVIYVNGYIYLNVRKINTTSYVTVIKEEVEFNLNEWNFFALDFLYRDDTGLDYKNGFVIKFNDYTFYESDSTGKYRTSFNKEQICHIASYESLNDKEMYLEGKLFNIFLKNRYMTISELDNYYKFIKDYIEENCTNNSSIVGVDYSSSEVNYNNEIFDKFTVYPLKNNLNSIKGEIPYKSQLRILNRYDLDRTFVFNKYNLHYAYKADGNELIYEPGISNCGTIMMNVFLEDSLNKQYLFEAKNSQNIKISLYRDTDNILYLSYNGYLYSTSFTIESKKWYSIGLSLDRTITSTSITTLYNKTFRVYCNGTVKEVSRSFAYDFNTFNFMIGRRYDAEKTTTYLGTISEFYPLNGQIEMLCFNDSYNNISTLNSLVSNFDTINHITNYDELQRTSKNVILYGDEEVVSNIYSYDDKLLSIIEYENIKPSNQSNIKRLYTYDSKGRIISITDSTFGHHSYEYDYRGYLVNDEDMSYTYDDNGNILSAGNNTYEYDSTIKDKVIKYNGSSILYNSNNPLNITKFNNMEFTYEGRRLKEIEMPYNNDYYYNIKYEYNEQGLRIKKIKEKWYYSADDDMTSEVTNYFYEGNNLITEINPNYRLDFLYDENNRLLGLVYNKTNKYFYVRDILNNILGLVDINGNLVVKYSCDSFGNILGYSDTSGIGLANNNPFRFKGYYYDTDIEMYYCKSRFYVPKLRRWLNADSFDYLEPENIEGVNLFAYCANDPVNYKQRPVSSGGSVVSSSISVGVSSVFAGESSGSGSLDSVGNPSAPGWLSTAVGAIPDFILGMKYLATKGMHSKFAYATNTRYMHPIMGGTWRWFGKTSSSFGTISQGTFKQILTGDARAGFGAIAKSVGSTVGLNALVNFGFNFYENNWQIDSSMLVDTAIDTAIGVSSYYLAAGTMSLATAGLLAAGVALPGIVVVGGVVILSIGFEHVIRAISGYWD